MVGFDLEESSSSDDTDITNLQPEYYAYLRSLRFSTMQRATEPGEPSTSCEPGPSGTSSGGIRKRKARKKKEKSDDDDYDDVGGDNNRSSDEETMVSAFKYICLEEQSNNNPEIDGQWDVVKGTDNGENGITKEGGEDEHAESKPSTNSGSPAETQNETQPDDQLQLNQGGNENAENAAGAPPPASAPTPLRRWRPLDGAMSSTPFQTFKIAQDMKITMRDTMGITTATILQEKAIPVLMNERDALIHARPGTGKTLAFAIPVVHHLNLIKPRVCPQDGIRAMIIVPSKENVNETYDIFKTLTKTTPWIVIGQIGGGDHIKVEQQILQKGVTILVATPQRLMVLLRHTSCVLLRNISHLIIDGLDEIYNSNEQKNLLDVVAALEKGLTQNPENEKNRKTGDEEPARQTVIITATLTEEVLRFAGFHTTEPMFMEGLFDLNPTVITIPVTSLGNQLPMVGSRFPSFSQYYMTVPEGMRLVALIAFFIWKCKMASQCKIVVYVATQTMVNFYTDWVKGAYGVEEDESEEAQEGATRRPSGLEVFKLSTYKSTRRNNEILNEFKKSRCGILFCKDGALTGLILPKVDWIIQFSPPTSTSNYAARVGLTDPTINVGASVLFVLPTERDFIEILREREVPITRLKMKRCLRYVWTSHRSSNSLEEMIYDIQSSMDKVIEGSMSMHDRACQAFASWCRSYSRYPRYLENIFHIKNVHMDRYAKCFGLYERPHRILQYARHLNAEKRRLGLQRRAERRAAKAVEAERARIREEKRERTARARARAAAWCEALSPRPAAGSQSPSVYRELCLNVGPIGDEIIFELPPLHSPPAAEPPRRRRFVREASPPTTGEEDTLSNEALAVEVPEERVLIELAPWADPPGSEPLPDLTTNNSTFEEPDSTTDIPPEVPDLLAGTAQEDILAVLPPRIEALSDDEPTPEPRPGPSRAPQPDEPRRASRTAQRRRQRKRAMRQNRGSTSGGPPPKRSK